MYLRTICRRNADGSVVRYYQLAENTWDPQKRCAVAKVVYSFGRGDESKVLYVTVDLNLYRIPVKVDGYYIPQEN